MGLRLLKQSLFEKATPKLVKWLYWPVCRAYARLVLGDKPADPLMRFLCSLQYWNVFGSWPDFVNPRLFSEKLWSRMLHSRDPLLKIVSDKLRVRDYLTDKVGNAHLVPLLWKGENPEDIPFDEMPDAFVIKTNHGCGFNIIVRDKAKLDRFKTKRLLRKWLKIDFCRNMYLGTEWGYKHIKPAIMVESFIGENGKPPLDYKFYCFAGTVELLTVHFDRHTNHATKAFLRDKSPCRFRLVFSQYDKPYQLPQNIDNMIELAESLAAGFDFIRVDLYSPGQKIYFGEISPYPAGVGAFTGFDISKLDLTLGGKWKL